MNVHVLRMHEGLPIVFAAHLEPEDRLSWVGPQAQWELDRHWLLLSDEDRAECEDILCYNGGVRGFGVPCKRNEDGAWLRQP